MKRLLLIASIATLSFAKLQAQCVYSCGNYAVSPVTFSTFPVGATPIPTANFLPSADDGTMTASIGFNFDFYCNTYQNVNICSNGFMQFDYGTPIDFGNPPYVNPTQTFPSAATPNGLVALNMNDFDYGAGGTISYTTVGVAPNRMFILTYDNVPIWYNALTNQPPSPVYNTGQIVLYETTNIIDIHTGAVGSPPNTGTQGIENTTGNAGLASPGRNNTIWSANASAYRFAPYTPTPPGPITGTTGICAGLEANYSILPIASALSYSWTAPGLWTGTSSTTAFTATTGLSGNVQVRATYTCGTSAPTNYSVTTIAAPNVAVSLLPSIICSGESITVTPLGALNYTLEPGTIIGTSPFVLAPNVPTTYTLYGADANNCTSFNNPSTFITVNESPTVTVNSGTTCAGQGFTMTPAGADAYTFSNGFASVSPAVAGVYNYSVTGTNTNGCVGIEAVSNLLVNPNPTISITATKLIVCSNGTTAITAGGADTYVWVNGPSTAVNTVTLGTTSQSFTVTGTTADGCSKTKAINIGVDFCVGIFENTNAQNRIAVYPNPSTGEFTLNTPEAIFVLIYDIHGKIVRQQNMGEGKHIINLTDLNAGQYFLKASSNSKTQSAILIKE